MVRPRSLSAVLLAAGLGLLFRPAPAVANPYMVRSTSQRAVHRTYSHGQSHRTYSYRPYRGGHGYPYRPYWRGTYRPSYYWGSTYWPSYYWPSPYWYGPTWYGYWPSYGMHFGYSVYQGGKVDYSYSTGSVRTQVEPKETEVYVDGAYAGIVDDFDGSFQRLYLPPGEHDVELRLEGYRLYRKRLVVSSGTTYKLHHDMEALGPGESTPPLPEPEPPERKPMAERPEEEPESRLEEPVPPPTEGHPSPASPFGILSVRVQPTDALIVIDGEPWGSLEGLGAMTIHLSAGPHRIEARRPGYETFAADIEVRQRETTALNVKLSPGAAVKEDVRF